MIKILTLFWGGGIVGDSHFLPVTYLNFLFFKTFIVNVSFSPYDCPCYYKSFKHRENTGNYIDGIPKYSLHQLNKS